MGQYTNQPQLAANSHARVPILLITRRIDPSSRCSLARIFTLTIERTFHVKMVIETKRTGGVMSAAKKLHLCKCRTSRPRGIATNRCAGQHGEYLGELS